MKILRKKNITIRSVYKILMLLFSLYLLYATFGIFLNSGINVQYEVYSIKDVAYIFFYSKVFMGYITLVLIGLIFSFRK